jgi:hypothetical protein
MILADEENNNMTKPYSEATCGNWWRDFKKFIEEQYQRVD